MVLAPGLQADEQTQAVPGAQRPPPRRLGQRCGGGAGAVITGWRGARAAGRPPPLPKPGSGPHPRAAWRRARRSRRRAPCTGRWSGSGLGRGGRRPRRRAAGAQTVTPGPPRRARPAPARPGPARTHQVVEAELVQRAPLHRRVPAQAAVEGGLDALRPRAGGQGRGPGSGSAHSRVRTAPGTERAVVAPGPLPPRGPPRRVPPRHLPQNWAPLRSRAPLPVTPGTASRAPALGNPRETCSGLRGLRNRLPDPAAARVSFHALATGKLRAGAPRTPFSCFTCLSYRFSSRGCCCFFSVYIIIESGNTVG